MQKADSLISVGFSMLTQAGQHAGEISFAIFVR